MKIVLAQLSSQESGLGFRGIAAMTLIGIVIVGMMFAFGNLEWFGPAKNKDKR
jgi:hypothetical protein